MMANFFQMNIASSFGSGSLPSNTVANPRGDLEAITTRSGVSYNGPPIPPPLLSSLPKVVEREPEVVILKKLPEKLGDPGKFLIPCDFQGMVECSALADLGASINLMPLSIWKKLSLPETYSLDMTSRACGTIPLLDQKVFAEDVFVKVGKFHYPADFIVVDYDVDPRVPFIFGRPFLRTARALIDVYGEEITLRFNDEAITFKVYQTLRYSYNNSESVNRIDVIDGFSEELSRRIDDADFDLEGDLLLLEKLLNDDLSSPLPHKELHFKELKTIKSSIDDPRARAQGFTVHA
ncbi:reverse transcriptase domain-containing protein [Tanacetum coccineum]